VWITNPRFAGHIEFLPARQHYFSLILLETAFQAVSRRMSFFSAE